MKIIRLVQLSDNFEFKKVVSNIIVMKFTSRQKPLALTIFVFLVFLALRLGTINDNLAMDGAVPKVSYENEPFPGNFLGSAQHPPLFQLSHSVFLWLLGTDNWVYRLPMLISSLLTAIMLYFYLKGKISYKHAVFAILALAVLPWNINATNNGLQLPVLTMFSFAALLLAEKYNSEKKKSYFYLLVLASVAATLVMFIAVVVPVTVALYILFNSDQKLKVRVWQIIRYGLVYAAITSILVGIEYLIFPQGILNAFFHVGALSSLIPVLGINSLIIFLLWIGPIILVLLFCLAKYGSLRTALKNIHVIFILLTAIELFLFNGDYARPFDRYFMLIIPSIFVVIVLQGKDAITRIFSKPSKYILIFMASLFILLAFGTMSNPKIIPLEPKSEFIGSFFANGANIMVPYSAASGPVGFYVPGQVLLLGWVSVFILVLAAWKKPSILAVALMVLLAMNLSVSLYENRLFGLPNGDLATADIINELHARPTLERTLYFKNFAIISYVEKTMPSIYNSKDFNEISYGSMNITGNFSIVIVDFPMIAKSSSVWSTASRCHQRYYSNKFGVGEYIFDCSFGAS